MAGGQASTLDPCSVRPQCSGRRGPHRGVSQCPLPTGWGSCPARVGWGAPPGAQAPGAGPHPANLSEPRPHTVVCKVDSSELSGGVGGARKLVSKNMDNEPQCCLSLLIVCFHFMLFSDAHTHPCWTSLPCHSATNSPRGLLTSLCFQLPRLLSCGCQKCKSPHSSRGGTQQRETQKEGHMERRTQGLPGTATPSGRGSWITL